jgi:hypothetical protein
MLKNLVGALCLMAALAFSPARAEPSDLTFIYIVAEGQVVILHARVQGGEKFPACFADISDLPAVQCYRVTGEKRNINNTGTAYGATIVTSVVIQRGRDM